MMLYADQLFGLLKAQCFPQVKHRPLQLGGVSVSERAARRQMPLGRVQAVVGGFGAGGGLLFVGGPKRR
jgi:hypothetical protein